MQGHGIAKIVNRFVCISAHSEPTQYTPCLIENDNCIFCVMIADSEKLLV